MNWKGSNVDYKTLNATYPWSSVTRIFRNGLPSHGGNRSRTFEVIIST